MLHVTLRGSYYEMGKKYGLSLREHDFGLPRISEKRLRLGLRSESLVKEFFPEILDEIQGVADSGELEYDKLAAFVLTVGSGGGSLCSVFAVANIEKVFFGRNYDWYYSDKDDNENYFTMPEKGYQSIGNTDIFVGREDGINEKGLAVAMSGIPAFATEGINFPTVVRCILDKCATVQEAVELLTEIPHMCTMSYTLADPTGDMAVVEVSPEKTVVRKPTKQEPFVISTNHFVDVKMHDIKIYEPPDSRKRYDTINGMLKDNASALNEELMISILRNHGGLVCSHHKSIRLGTLWSVVAELKQLRILRAEAQPCETEYQVDRRLNEALQKRKNR